MKPAWKTEVLLLRRRWPELLFLLFLSVCVGLYRTLGRGEVTAMRMLTNQQFALLPCWGLAEVLFRDRQGGLTYRVSVLTGHTRGGVFAAKLVIFLLLSLMLDALGCCAALGSQGRFSPAVLPMLLLRLGLDLGYAAVLLLIAQLPLPNAPTRYLLSGGSALALGVIGGMRLAPMALSIVLLLVCPVAAWSSIRRCEL